MSTIGTSRAQERQNDKEDEKLYIYKKIDKHPVLVV